MFGTMANTQNHGLHESWLAERFIVVRKIHLSMAHTQHFEALFTLEPLKTWNLVAE